MPKAKPSTRATDHVTLGFGLVQIPVSVYTGTVSDHGITRNEFVRVPVLEEVIDPETGKPALDPFGKVEMRQVMVETEVDGKTVEVPAFTEHPAGRGSINKDTGELVPREQEIVRKIATEYGHVYVSDEEVEDLFEINPKSIVIKGFQPQALFYRAAYEPRTLYFVEPRKVGSGAKRGVPKGTREALAMLFKAMREEGAMAVVEFTTRGISKPGILLPDGTLRLVYHTDALREQRELEEAEINPVVVAQGRTLLRALWSDEPMDLTDERSALIQAFADEKARAGDFTKPEEGERVDAPEEASEDLMAMLQASVAAATEVQAVVAKAEAV